MLAILAGVGIFLIMNGFLGGLTWLSYEMSDKEPWSAVAWGAVLLGANLLFLAAVLQ